MTNLKTGDIVRVYQRPLTKEDFEGRAKLIEHVRDDDWMVSFVDEPGDATYRRKVFADDKEE